MKRIRYIDTAKGVGILLVIVHHTYGLSPFFTSCFMPFFFMLSSMTYFPKTDRPLRQDVGRRVLPLIKAYLLYLLPLVALHGAIDYQLHDAVITPAWVLRAVGGMLYARPSFYPVPPAGWEELMVAISMWFVAALAVGYAVFIPLQRGLHSLRTQTGSCAGWVTAAVVAGLVLLCDRLARLPVLLPWSLDTLPATVLFLLAGYAVQKYGFLRKGRPLWQILLIACAALAAYCLLLSLSSGKVDYAFRLYGSGGAPMFLGLGLTGGLFLICACFLLDLTPLGRILSWFGRHSLFILAFHQAVHEVLFRLLLVHLHMRYTLKTAAVEWAVMLAALSIGIIVLEWIKKRIKKPA